MKTCIAFIQSVSGKEWEIGEMINDEINHNPNYCDCNSETFCAKTYQELEKALEIISNYNQLDSIIIQIDAHSNSEYLVFKDVQEQDKDKNSDCVEWSRLYEKLNCLYKKEQDRNMVIIFISCYSSTYAKTINSPHIPIMAAEGKIAPRRAGEQLIKFYDRICTGSNIKEAYDYMINSFPIEDELKRDEKDKSILKLYM